jgi:hypothetical protein
MIQLKIDAKPAMRIEPRQERHMKRSSICKIRSVAGKLMMGIVFAAMVGSINVLPALGDDHERKGKHDTVRAEHKGRGHDRDAYDRRDYGERVYAAPPVIYEPPPQPGISIFLPFHR